MRSNSPSWAGPRQVAYWECWSLLAGSRIRKCGKSRFWKPQALAKLWTFFLTECCISTNYLTKKMTLQGEINNWRCLVWLDPYGKYIWTLTPLWKTLYEKWKEDSFLLHSYDIIVKSNQTNEGLYVYCPKDAYMNSVTSEKRCPPY